MKNANSILKLILVMVSGVGIPSVCPPSFADTRSAASSGPSTPSCEIDVPQGLILGNVDAFEFDDSFGITFG